MINLIFPIVRCKKHGHNGYNLQNNYQCFNYLPALERMERWGLSRIISVIEISNIQDSYVESGRNQIRLYSHKYNRSQIYAEISGLYQKSEASWKEIFRDLIFIGWRSAINKIKSCEFMEFWKLMWNMRCCH